MIGCYTQFDLWQMRSRAQPSSGKTSRGSFLSPANLLRATGPNLEMPQVFFLGRFSLVQGRTDYVPTISILPQQQPSHSAAAGLAATHSSRHFSDNYDLKVKEKMESLCLNLTEK